MHLKEYLESRDLAASEFAKMLGVSQNCISNYILYKRLPNLEIGRAIELATKGKVTIDEMIETYRKFHGR
jgi:predicted transcriptional regulator